IQVAEGQAGEPRFRWLETIRAYALQQLMAEAEVVRAQQRHALYFVELAEAAEAALVGHGMGETLDRLEREYDNFRAVLHWALDGGDLELGLRLAGALYRFWMLRGHLGEARQWLARALAHRRDLPNAVRRERLTAAGGL